MKGVLHTDGACLGNPGPMGLGIVLEREDGKEYTLSEPAGHGTNNIAEYSALIRGLQLAQQKDVTSINAYLDSQLVVEQVNGNWRVKDKTLAALHEKVQELLAGFTEHTIEHVRREHNRRADMLSKAAAERV